VNYTVKIIDWNIDGELCKAIRSKVFIEEQGVPIQEELDDKDGQAKTLHFLALDGDKPVGTARLINHQQIGRMAVLKDYRSKSVGALLLRAVVRKSLELHQSTDAMPRIHLHSQISATGFYEKYGFTVFGEEFLDAGIPHRPMSLNWEKGETLEHIFQDEVIRLNRLSDFHFHLHLLTISTSRYLDILCDSLNPQLYGAECVVSAVSSLARRSRSSSIRILLRDSSSLQGVHHPLVSLSQRLSSKIEIRVLSSDYKPKSQSYAVFDRRRILFFNNESEMKGFVNYLASAEARHEKEEFERCWEQYSCADPNLAALHI